MKSAMAEEGWLAGRFEANRGRLRAVAYRMLGSLAEADDAVQEAWLRLSRADASAIENLGGWLTTVVARVCLDMLRARKSRREESIEIRPSQPEAPDQEASDPEQEALLADAVGLALLVVLDRLAPAERLAFVLHDMLAMPFEEIAPILKRSVTATRQLASRARRRVRGTAATPRAAREEQRTLVGAFLAALRAGDVEAMIAVLAPDVVVRVDQAAAGAAREIRGARNWAQGAVAFSRATRMVAAVRPALVEGAAGLVWAPRGRLLRAVSFTFAGGKIARLEIIADPARLAALHVALSHE